MLTNIWNNMVKVLIHHQVSTSRWKCLQALSGPLHIPKALSQKISTCCTTLWIYCSLTINFNALKNKQYKVLDKTLSWLIFRLGLEFPLTSGRTSSKHCCLPIEKESQETGAVFFQRPQTWRLLSFLLTHECLSGCQRWLWDLLLTISVSRDVIRLDSSKTIGITFNIYYYIK